MMAPAKSPKRFDSVGKRKTSIARIFTAPGDGKILINERDLPAYFGRESLRCVVQQPFEVTGAVGKYDVLANIAGGGLASQADALRHAIAKSLIRINPDFRKPLKSAGLLTRDSRIVERKKYGRRGARRSPQYSKR